MTGRWLSLFQRHSGVNRCWEPPSSVTGGWDPPLERQMLQGMGRDLAGATKCFLWRTVSWEAQWGQLNSSQTLQRFRLWRCFGLGIGFGSPRPLNDSGPLAGFFGGLPPPKQDSYLVDSASSHMLVSKIKPCMSKYKQLYGETANGSLNQLSFI